MRTNNSLLQVISFILAFGIFHLPVSYSQNATNTGSIPKNYNLAGMKPGEVVVITLEGTATAVESTTGKTKKLVIGDRLLQGWTILTKGKSKVGLGFANGTFIEVAPNSKFVIQEFFIEPWDVAATDIEKMESEPSKSKTTLVLEVGQVLMDIKKLKSGSGMDVTTPLASAGIRGTTGQITHTVNTDGTPKSTTVNVPDGSMTVTPTGGGDGVNASGQNTAIISTAAGSDGQGTTIQISTGRSDPATSASILQGAQTLQSNGMQTFIQGMSAAAQSPQSFGQNLSPDQRQQLQEANETGGDALLEAVSNLSTETPSSAPEIAQFATTLSIDLAPQIAAAATAAAPQSAVFISVAVSVVAPSIAPQIASSVAAVAPPNLAPLIAGATASAVPTQAPLIAGQVALTVPDAAVQIAQAVAQAQPQQVQQITQNIINQVPQGDAAAIQNAAQTGAQQGAANTQPTGVVPQPDPGGNSGRPIQPISGQ